MDRSSDIRRRRDRGRAGGLGTVQGEAQKLGNGLAQIYAELDAEGAPRVIGVSFDRAMLEGLPEMPNTYSRCFDKNANGRIDDHHECNGDYELAFALPEELARTTPFKWVSVNWNPMGSPAAGAAGVGGAAPRLSLLHPGARGGAADPAGAV